TFGAKKVSEQFQAATALVGTFVVNSVKTVAASALAALKLDENTMKAVPSDNEKVRQGLKEISGLLEEYRKSLTKLIENSKELTDFTPQLPGSGAGFTH